MSEKQKKGGYAMKSKKLLALIIVFLIIAGVAGFSVYEITVGSKAGKISASDAEKLINSYMDSSAVTKPMKLIAEKNNIKVIEQKKKKKKKGSARLHPPMYTALFLRDMIHI